jgi:hypothetical protein
MFGETFRKSNIRRWSSPRRLVTCTSLTKNCQIKHALGLCEYWIIAQGVEDIRTGIIWQKPSGASRLLNHGRYLIFSNKLGEKALTSASLQKKYRKASCITL